MPVAINKKTMLKHFKFFAFIVLLSAACSKESATNNATSGNTGTGGSLAKFTIAGNYLYIVSNANLNVFDITKSTPVLQPTVWLNGYAETIFPYNDKLFIGSTTGMFIYSLSNPKVPVLLGEARHVRSCDPVVANDSIAFVTLRGTSACGPAKDGLYIHNIKNILNPVLIKTVEMPTPHGLGLKDSLLYICQQENGLSIYNIQNPAKPVLRTTIEDDYYNDVIVYDDLLICYVQSGLKLYSITKPANPRLLSTVAN
jgi:hypothetical protein